MFRILSMRRLGILLVAALSLCCAQNALATIGLVQHPSTACAGASCNITVTSTGGGDIGIVVYYQQAGATPTLSSVSDGTSTWTVSGTCGFYDSNGGLGIAYTLNLAAGKTTITVTPSGAGFNGFAEFIEYSQGGSAGSPTFDVCGAQNSSGGTSQLGMTLTLTGSNDVIVQAIAPQGGTVSAISGSYTNPADFINTNQYGAAAWINTNSGTRPTWTQSSASISHIAAIAITEHPLIAPLITSANAATFTLTVNNSFTVTASGNPASSFSETGTLPSGVTLSAGGILSGIPGSAGSFSIVITANNGVAPNATQNFTLTAQIAPSLGGQVISSPILPQLVPTTTFPGEQASVLTPANGAALTTALTGVACGTTIRLAHGVTYSTATAFPLTTNCMCRSASNVYNSSQWIIIESDSYIGGSVRGNQLDPSTEYSKLAYISSTDTNEAFNATNNGAGCYWLLGLDIFENGANNFAGVSWGDESSLNFPHDLVVDHSYVHGSPTLTMQHCIDLNGSWEAVVDSYVSDCHAVGQDTQAVGSRDGPGPVLIQNNTLMGAGENILVGGADSTQNTLESDWTVQGNYIWKPYAWRVMDSTYAGFRWTVKNLFEYKDMNRSLVTGNVFSQHWADGQTGAAFPFDVGNQSGTQTHGTIEDINFNFNILQHAGMIGNIASASGFPVSQPGHRQYFHDNLYTDIDSVKWGGARDWLFNPVSGALFAPYDIWFNHETLAADAAGANHTQGLIFGNTAGTDLYYGIQFTNSIIDTGSLGTYYGNAVGPGNAVITNFVPNANFKNNCVYGSGGGVGNLSNFANTVTVANQAAIFVNPGSDWHVAASSTCHLIASDGLNPGANIDAVNAATAGVIKTLGTPITVTNVSPLTFTHAGGTALTITGTGFLNESGLGAIVGGAGPPAAVNTVTCSMNTCTVVMTGTISLQVGDTVNIAPTAGYVEANNEHNQHTVASVTDNQHFTYTSTNVGTQSWSGGTANRNSPGNACTSVMVTNSTTITCNTPAATGAVTTGPVSVFVSQWGIPVQSTVFGNYN